MICQQFVMWVKVPADYRRKLSDRKLFGRLRADIETVTGLPPENLTIAPRPELSGFTALVNTEKGDPSTAMVGVIRRHFHGAEVEVRASSRTSAVITNAQLKIAA